MSALPVPDSETHRNIVPRRGEGVFVTEGYNIADSGEKNSLGFAEPLGKVQNGAIAQLWGGESQHTKNYIEDVLQKISRKFCQSKKNG